MIKADNASTRAIRADYTVYTVEIPVHHDCDPSTLLEHVQHLALQLAEEYGDEHGHGLGIRTIEAIEEVCSVQESDS